MSAEQLIRILNGGDADKVSDFLGDLFEKIEQEEPDPARQENVAMMVSAVIPALIWQREEEGRDFSAAEFDDYFSLDHIAELYENADLPEELGEILAEYLESDSIETTHSEALKTFHVALDSEE